MHLGKSSSLNNFYTLLTGKEIRIFSELECDETNTRGNDIIHVKFSDLISLYKEKFIKNLN